MPHRYDTRLYKGYDPHLDGQSIRQYDACDGSLTKSDVFSLFNIFGISRVLCPRHLTYFNQSRQPLLTGYTPSQDQQTLAVAVVGSAVALAAVGGIFWIKRKKRLQAETDEKNRILALNKADEEDRGGDCGEKVAGVPGCVAPCLGRSPIRCLEIHACNHQASVPKCRPHRCRKGSLAPAVCSTRTATATTASPYLQSPVIPSWGHKVPLVTTYRSGIVPVPAPRRVDHTRVVGVQCERDKSQNESGLPECLANLPRSLRVSCRADTCSMGDTCTGTTRRFNRSSSTPACLKQGSHPPVFSRIFPTHSNRLKMSEQVSAPNCEPSHDPTEIICCTPKTFYKPHGPDTSDTRRASWEEMEVKMEVKVHQECFTSVREPCCPAPPHCTDCTCLCHMMNAQGSQASGAECQQCQDKEVTKSQ